MFALLMLLLHGVSAGLHLLTLMPGLETLLQLPLYCPAVHRRNIKAASKITRFAPQLRLKNYDSVMFTPGCWQCCLLTNTCTAATAAGQAGDHL
jgi:hypothetical protein